MNIIEPEPTDDPAALEQLPEVAPAPDGPQDPNCATTGVGSPREILDELGPRPALDLREWSDSPGDRVGPGAHAGPGDRPGGSQSAADGAG